MRNLLQIYKKLRTPRAYLPTFLYFCTILNHSLPMKHYAITLLCVFLTALTAMAQAPAGTYYAPADGKKGATLKTELCDIINPHTNVGYNGVWQCYLTTDVRPDGKIWDMYSDCTNYVPGGPAQGKNYSKEGDSYNREHSIPQSWFSERSPMKADLFHVYPTDGFINNMRSNFPFGEVANPTKTSHNGFCKLGPCSTPGYSGTVFEPADEYKGDFARTYFYMATCYENEISSWSGEVFGCGKYPGMEDWCISMFLRWAQEDPVSEKETNRNEAVYEYQENRNPFIDYPGLEQYLWGTHKAVAFSYDHYVNPYLPEGIGTVLEAAADAPLYDLQGTPAYGQSSRRGIYIQHGRKVLRR